LTAFGYFASSFALLRYPNIDPQLLPNFLSPWARVIGFATVAVLLAVAWRTRASRPEFLFAVFWLFAWVGPLYFFPIRNDAIAERHFYPVLWGVAFPVAIVWARWMGRGPAQRHIGAVIATCVAVALFAVTLTRNADYRSEVALWEAARRGAPEKLRVLNNLGVVYMEAGRWEDARTTLERAALIGPDDERIRANLNDARRGRFHPEGWEPMSD
jgi:tetratricopeptide (TPR) repeat protein